MGSAAAWAAEWMTVGAIVAAAAAYLTYRLWREGRQLWLGGGSGCGTGCGTCASAKPAVGSGTAVPAADASDADGGRRRFPLDQVRR